VNVLAVVSAKGGVGKTTLTANLGAALGKGRRVVCLDLDPQNALRLHLGVAMDEHDGISRCTLEGRRWNTAIFQSPGSPEVLPFGTITENDRDAFEVHLAEHSDWLERGLEHIQLAPTDMAILDTPPGPSLYLQQALRVANYVLIVLHADAASYATVPAMESLIQRYCAERPEFKGSAYVLNNVNTEKALSRDIVEILRTNLGGRLTPMVIHQDEAVRESLASDQLLADYDPHCVATYDVASCADWVRDKMLSTRPAFAARR
jgi:cellulose synthase operon protein YhjQ